jgi:hypothetical protein
MTRRRWKNVSQPLGQSIFFTAAAFLLEQALRNPSLPLFRGLGFLCVCVCVCVCASLTLWFVLCEFFSALMLLLLSFP